MTTERKSLLLDIKQHLINSGVNFNIINPIQLSLATTSLLDRWAQAAAYKKPATSYLSRGHAFYLYLKRI